MISRGRRWCCCCHYPQIKRRCGCCTSCFIDSIISTSEIKTMIWSTAVSTVGCYFRIHQLPTRCTACACMGLSEKSEWWVCVWCACVHTCKSQYHYKQHNTHVSFSKSSLMIFLIQSPYCTVTSTLSSDHTSQSGLTGLRVYCCHVSVATVFTNSIPSNVKLRRPETFLKVEGTIKLLLK